MSTRITVETLSDDLPTRNRQLQRANRLNQLEQEEDRRALEQARRLQSASEAAQRFAASADGAVPEFKIRSETSAQRGGRDFGMGWVYETFANPREHPWATKWQYRISVGSGDGTQWQYTDVEQDLIAGIDQMYLTRGVGFYSQTGTEALYSYTYYDGAFFSDHLVIPIGGAPNAGAIIAGVIAVVTKTTTGTRQEGVYLPISENTTTNTTRKNFAFFVCHDRCKQIEVPAQLAAILENVNVVASIPSYGYLDNTHNLPGPAYGPLQGTPYYYADLFYGTPGAYDILDNNWNDDIFYRDDRKIISAVTNRITLTAPDFTTGQIGDNGFEGSAFWFVTEAQRLLNANPGIDIKPPGQYYNSPVFFFAPDDAPPFEHQQDVYGETPRYYNGGVFMRLPEYLYLPPTLRQGSAFYAQYPQKQLLDSVPTEPEFIVLTRDDNPNPPGVTRNTENFPEYLPEGDYKVGAKLKLSANRILPPAIFNSADTTHPLVQPQPVPFRYYSYGIPGGETFYLADTTTRIYPRNCYSQHKFFQVLWCDWKAGRQWQRLSQYGLGNVR